MRIAIAVTEAGEIGGGWGRAARVAVADVQQAEIAAWREFDVGWDALHDVGTEGGHHARIARFLRDNQIEVVAAGHMGPPMADMLRQMGIRAVVGVAGAARDAALELASTK